MGAVCNKLKYKLNELSIQQPIPKSKQQHNPNCEKNKLSKNNKNLEKKHDFRPFTEVCCPDFPPDGTGCAGGSEVEFGTVVPTGRGLGPEAETKVDRQSEEGHAVRHGLDVDARGRRRFCNRNNRR